VWGGGGVRRDGLQGSGKGGRQGRIPYGSRDRANDEARYIEQLWARTQAGPAVARDPAARSDEELHGKR